MFLRSIVVFVKVAVGTAVGAVVGAAAGAIATIPLFPLFLASGVDVFSIVVMRAALITGAASGAAFVIRGQFH
jgi:hypothetical protein